MKKQYNRKTIRKSIILMFIASTCQNMENPSYNSLTVSKINQGLLFLIRFKLFQTDIHKILHYRRRLPPLLPDQKDLRHQIRFIKHLTSQPFAKPGFMPPEIYFPTLPCSWAADRYNISLTSELFPEPETPVTQVSTPNGIPGGNA